MKLIMNGHHLKIKDTVLEFDKIIKIRDAIICILDGTEYCKFEGVNFNNFQVEGGEFEEEITQTDLQQEVNAKLLKDSANLQIELNKQKELNATLLMQIAQLGGR